MPRRKAVPGIPAADFRDDTEYSARMIALYEQRNKVLQEIIDEGPRVRATATGFEQLDLDTCSCKSFGSRRKDHAEFCTVKIVRDSLPVVAAIKEMRLNDQRLDALRKETSPNPDQTEAYNEFVSEVQALIDERDQLRAENESLRRQLGDAYAVPAILS